MTPTRLGLLAALLIGAALRLLFLDRAPPGLYYDEAANAIDALHVLAGERPLFFVGNQGREPLHIYLTALATALVGPGWLAVRLPSLLAGLLTIPAAYLLGRELGSRTVGALAALLLATSYWHVHLSRLGFRAVWVPLVAGLALALLLRSLRTGRVGPGLLAGGLVGLGLYTYIAARVLPLVALSVLVLAVVMVRPRPRLAVLAAPVAAMLLVAAPLAAYFARHPERFWERVESASGGPLGLPERLWSAIGLFLWAGDAQARHNLPERPVFEALAGGLFLLGVGLALRRPTLPSLSVLGLVAAGLLPQALASGEPHFLRAAAVMPGAQVLAALGLATLLGRVAAAPARAAAVFALGLLWTGLAARDYLLLWAPSREAHLAFDSSAREASRLLCAAETPRPLAAGSPLYRDRPTFFLDAACPPDAAFDGARALVLPPAGDAVLVTEPDALPPGVRARLGDPELLAGRWATERGPPLQLFRPPAGALVPPRPIPATIGGVLALEGHALRPIMAPGEEQVLELGWRVLGPAPAGLYQFAHVVRPGPNGEEVWARDDVAAYPSAAWRGGEQGLTWFRLRLPPDAPPGAYWVSTGLYRAPGLDRLPIVDGMGRPSGDTLRLGPFKLWRPERARLRPLRPLAVWENGAVLERVELPRSAAPGSAFDVRLRWWSPGPTSRPLTVFAHLLEQGQRERAGSDGAPDGGRNPTDLWQPGETIDETRRFALPADAAPGRYALEVGFYDPATGARLPLSEAPERLGDGALVGWLEVR